MDIPREQHKGRRLIRRILIALILAGVIVTVTVGLSRLEPAAPSVEREMLLMDTVQRGNMILQVRGVGKLMSEDMLIVPAMVAGRVKRILVEAGTPVEPNTVILELTNPNLQLAWLDAQSQLNLAQANFMAEQASLQDRLLGMEAGLARARASHEAAELQRDVDEKQFEDGLISDLQIAQSRSRVRQQETLLEIERKRFKVFEEQSLPAQLAAAQATVEQAKSRYDLSKNEVASLLVRAGVAGVLAPVQTRIEPGQQVSAGQILGRITDPVHLKARLQIPQGQARDVAIGLPCEIDTYNGVVAGTVSRIDPTVVQGNVTVDVSLTGELPRGARPDLSVIGTIEIDRLVDILYVGRPVMAGADSKASLFKLIEDGKFAQRIPIQFGRTSVSTIEIIEGLALGEQIILSDVSQWDMVDRIRVK
ncbi:MAG: HlyD family efflux transporter periplasmic adaptor subunit [Planctomycetes bacterium]|nr:HlyD family efflux transporter periplasmic adaptor subunit [Planctomycetota bacterium]